MHIGPGQLFDNGVVHLPKTNTNRTPGLELVGVSQANDNKYLAIDKILYDKNIISIRKSVTKIAYEKRRKELQ